MLMFYIDTNMMYHLIKSQSVIKLYIFYNMLEVGDRLFSAFGQDTIDALFWTATEPRDRRREHLGLIPHLLFAIIYVCILFQYKIQLDNLKLCKFLLFIISCVLKNIFCDRNIRQTYILIFIARYRVFIQKIE